ncbi:uncharacterized protein BDW43DRAFT_4107 [Aspergillus alliaceus]|uniref:uncharacterized protein n=1 Tax=Petromyces alliaceus TaxID=209559 RepID=UPI0012A4E44E|nr:uncharacterized protein BDW43DRAFT_4107 [Aspergillus alliaceus]KAB8239430.1 hypothetical protein BDW43DRAFT_4107 [Aspergillus alliaceus]
MIVVVVVVVVVVIIIIIIIILDVLLTTSTRLSGRRLLQLRTFPLKAPKWLQSNPTERKLEGHLQASALPAPQRGFPRLFGRARIALGCGYGLVPI